MKEAAHLKLLLRPLSYRERFLRMLCKGSGFAVQAAEQRWAAHTAGGGLRDASGSSSRASSGLASHVPITLLHLARTQ